MTRNDAALARQRARLRMVEENVRASAYIEDLAAELGQRALEREARELRDDLHVVQFCVELGGDLDPETESLQHRINRRFRQRFAKLKGRARASFDAVFRPQGGWEKFYRTRGL